MTKDDLTFIYRQYIACLNAQDWDSLPSFVDEDGATTAEPWEWPVIAPCLRRTFPIFQTSGSISNF
jgi:predicted ester cyclase